MRDDSRSDTRPAWRAADRTGCGPTPARGTVLVVDDDPAIHVVAERILHEAGYRVIPAWDGLEGAEIFAARHREIDVVLMDLVMPRLSGKDAYCRMRQLDPGVKVIMASGFPDDSRIREALSLGVDAFVPKPYTLTSLVGALNELLGRRTD